MEIFNVNTFEISFIYLTLKKERHPVKSFSKKEKLFKAKFKSSSRPFLKVPRVVLRYHSAQLGDERSSIKGRKKS